MRRLSGALLCLLAAMAALPVALGTRATLTLVIARGQRVRVVVVRARHQ